MTKKVFAISTLILILLIGVIFVYNFAFKKPAASVPATKTVDEGKTDTISQSTESASSSVSTTGGTSKQLAGSIVAISDVLVFGAVLAPDGNSIYAFSASNGQLNQIDFEGKLQKVVSSESFQDIQEILWNKQRNKVYVKRSVGTDKFKFLLSDIAQKAVVPLKDNVDNIAWSSLGDKIVYKYFDPKTRKRTLDISDPNGSNWRKIADVNYPSMQIASVTGASDISFWPTPDAYTSSEVHLVSFSGENNRSILKDRFGVDLLWSPDGKLAAISSTDQKGGKKTDLGVMNSDGGQFHSLNFPTFVKKCAWSNDSKNLFCALPGNIPETSILPNDWQEGKIQTADTFWKIEVATGEKDRLIEADKINGSFDVLEPFLSQDEKTLFFKNKADGKLYRLAL